MSIARLVLRSLMHYRRTGALIAFGIAIATAVITGSLVIGNSVSGSIRDTALSGLGKITHVLVAPGFFRSDLAREVADSKTKASAIIVQKGTAQNPNTEASIPNVNVYGIDDSFAGFYSNAAIPRLSEREIAINEELARDLGVKHGDTVMLNVSKGSAVPTGTLFTKKSREDTLETIRLEVKAILPTYGPASLRFDAGTNTPRTLYASRDWLATQLDKTGKANAIVAESASEKDLAAKIKKSARLEDYGLKIVPNTNHDCLSVQSASVVLNDAQTKAIKDAASSLEANSAVTSTYLATTIRDTSNNASIAYSVAAGLERLPSLKILSGTEDLGKDGIILNSWAAADLKATMGDKIELEYLIPNADGTYATRSLGVTLRGIADLSGAASDKSIVPDFDGITNADRIDDWSTPFPIDLTRITQRDEDYWDKYKATPKAFVSTDIIRKMWAAGSSNNSLWVTSVRVSAKPSNHKIMTTDPKAHKAAEEIIAFSNAYKSYDLEKKLPSQLLKRLDPKDSGLVFRPIRKLAFAASAGTTDFGQLFLGMSFFIMLAGAGLAATLMRLMAEQRTSEAGILLSTGWHPKNVTRAIIAEGAVISAIGTVIGAGIGIGYAWAMIRALTTVWTGALNMPALWLHISPNDILIGAVAGFLLGIASTWMGARGLAAKSPVSLLSGWKPDTKLNANRRSKLTFTGASFLLAFAMGLVATSKTSQTAAFFISGMLLLISGMLFAGHGMGCKAIQRFSKPSITVLAFRYISANRKRSLLTVGLLAGASFIIVATAANTRDFSRADLSAKSSGTGGFALRAMSSLPLHYDLNSAKGRENFGFQPYDEELFKNVGIYSFLVSPGDDISCLNAAKPSSPRVLGVSADTVRRGGFTVITESQSKTNPWELLSSNDDIIPVFGDADSVMWTLHSGLGKTTTIVGENGKQIPVRIVGLIKGSIFQSELLMSEANFKRVYPGVGTPRYFLIETQDKPAVAEALRRNLGDLGVDVRGTDDILNAFIKVQNTYLSMFLALGGLGLLLGTVGLVTVILRSAYERRREFALMAASGFRKNQLSAILLIENSILIIVGMIVGLIAALVAVAPQITSSESDISWKSIAVVLLSILVVGLGSSIVAASKAVGEGIITALREE